MIGLIAATRLEAEPIVNNLGLSAGLSDPFPIFENNEVRLIISGIGKANAAMATAYLVLCSPLACVCNLGAAGATGEGRSLGACLHVGQVIEPDRMDFTTLRAKTHAIDTLEGFNTVSLATQDSPVVDNDQRRRLALFAELVDMEAAAVTQTCHRLHIRCHVFKFVSDTPEHGDFNLIQDNILKHREAFARFFVREVWPRLV